MLRDEGVEVTDDIGVQSAGQPGVDGHLVGDDAEVLEPCGLGAQDVLAGELGERRATPLPEGLLGGPDRQPWVAVQLAAGAARRRPRSGPRRGPRTPTSSRYPGGRVSIRGGSDPERNRRRRRDTWVCRVGTAVGGGRGPQTASTRRSTGTTRPRSAIRTARISRGFDPPSATTDPSSVTSTGPSTRQSIPALSLLGGPSRGSHRRIAGDLQAGAAMVRVSGRRRETQKEQPCRTSR